MLRNIKNYNNGLGHPLTVLNLADDKSYDVAVLEMGMSTPMNEIARLCRITPPDVAVELNVLPVHVEHLGSIENVAKAKAELVEGMKPGGTAVLNADDPRVAAMRTAEQRAGRSHTASRTRRTCGRRIFALSGSARRASRLTAIGERRRGFVSAQRPAQYSQCSGRRRRRISLSGCGRARSPQALNGRAAAAAWRGAAFQAEGFTVINDSYNSNPAALLSMVETLVEGSAGANAKIVVAGEMLELGDDAAAIHRETGEKIAESGVDMLIGVRGSAQEMVDGARDAGLNDAEFAEDSDAAGEMSGARSYRPATLFS